jgi:hypothetical protein
MTITFASCRDCSRIVQDMTTGQFLGGVKLIRGRQITQRIDPARHLAGIAVQFVNWRHTPSNCSINWKAPPVSDGQT